MKLQDKVSIITGGASGIGRAAALLFAQEGARVVVADKNDAKGFETARLITKQGGHATFVRTDVSDVKEVKSLVAQAIAAYGRIDVLFSNAGYVDEFDDAVTELREDAWDRIMGVNLRGMYLVAKYTLPEMVKGGGGAIVNTSSVGGLHAMDSTGYPVSKAGVISLTKCIAQQYARQHVRCNCICPGSTETPIAELAAANRARRRVTGFRPKEPLLGRKALPEEMARSALFLASDDASYVTGAVFVIDGGSTVR